MPDSRRGISSCRSHCTSASRPSHSVAKPPESRHIAQLAGKLEVTNWQFSFECGLSCSVLVSTYPMATEGTGVKRRNWRRSCSDRPPRPSPAAPPPALHHTPRTCAVAAVPPGGSRRASRRSNSVRTLPWWMVGAGSGRVPGFKLADGTAASATCRISGSLGGPEIR
jgi:hypothetical protein